MPELSKWVADGYELLAIKRSSRCEIVGKPYVAIMRRSPNGIKTIFYIKVIPPGFERFLDKAYVWLPSRNTGNNKKSI